MTPTIKSLISYDVDDLETWDPGERFWVALELTIGPAGEPGEDLFQIFVCSPSGLADKLGEGEVMDGRHHLFMTRYDYITLRAWLEQKVAEAADETWGDVAIKLSRIGAWEFEDYRPPEWSRGPS